MTPLLSTIKNKVTPNNCVKQPCAICYDDMTTTDSIQLACGHRFHWGCELQLLRCQTSNFGCALCRSVAIDSIPSTEDGQLLIWTCKWLSDLYRKEQTYQKLSDRVPRSLPLKLMSHTTGRNSDYTKLLQIAREMVLQMECRSEDRNVACRAYMKQQLMLCSFYHDA